jgi:hypothetical protein
MKKDNDRPEYSWMPHEHQTMECASFFEYIFLGFLAPWRLGGSSFGGSRFG